MKKIKNKKNVGNLLEECQTSKQKNKFAIFGLISDILWLFFIMVSMFFVRVWWSGILLLIWFSLLFVWFILWIIWSRREPKVHFPIFVFIIIPIWFIIMFSINYFINNISLTNNIIRRWWFWSFWLWIILWIIELYKIYRSFRIFIIIPLGLCCFVFLFFVWIFYYYRYLY